MKHFLPLAILLFFLACGKSEEAEKASQKPIEPTILTPLGESENRGNKVDLDSLLKDPFNGFLAEFSEGELSLCCYDLIDVSDELDLDLFHRSIERYSNEQGADSVFVYTIGKSFLKYYQNNHPDVQHLDLVVGKINNSALLKSKLVTIGMEKEEFLHLIFNPSDSFIDIEKLTVVENELGEAQTSYIFNAGRLEEIWFKSAYDWVLKEN